MTRAAQTGNEHVQLQLVGRRVTDEDVVCVGEHDEHVDVQLLRKRPFAVRFHPGRSSADGVVHHGCERAGVAARRGRQPVDGGSAGDPLLLQRSEGRGHLEQRHVGRGLRGVDGAAHRDPGDGPVPERVDGVDVLCGLRPVV